MKTTKHKPRPVSKLIADPRTFVSRLILAEVVAKRGRGPLEPKRVVYAARKR